MEAPIRVLLADDHPVVRAGLRAVLTTDPEIDVVAETSAANEAVQLVQDFTTADDPIDVVLMDLRFGESPSAGTSSAGVAVTKKILALPDAPYVLIVTNYSSDTDVLGAISAGAVGYLLKDADPDELIDGVKTAARGETVLSSQVAGRLMGRMRNPTASLSSRETEVLKLVATGLSNKKIAAQLILTEATVKSHMAHIFTKLNVKSRTAAVAAAREQGII